MAIFRFEAKIISRGGGKSTVASASYRTGGKSAMSAAAYRAGEKLTDERTGETYDYTAKRGILGAEIMLPASAPAWMADRAALWNHVEMVVEKRKDAQLAYDYIISIPHELSPEQRIAVVRDFVREQFVAKGFVADIAWHAPSKSELNVHAHVMTSMRRIEDGAFTRKKDRPPAGMHPMIAWQERLQELRVQWEATANRHLEAAGLDIRIDHRSLEARGIDREPQSKLGPVAAQREENGLGSHAGDDLRAVRARNAERDQLKVELADVVMMEAEIISLLDARARRSGMSMSPEDLAKDRLHRIEEAVEAVRKLDEASQEQLTLEVKRQAERVEAMKAAQQEQQAKSQRELGANQTEEEQRRRDGQIASPEARYAIAVGQNVSADPYASLIRAAGAESAAFVKEQEGMRLQLADPKLTDFQRKEITLRKEVEFLEYRALTDDRIAGLNRVVGGREHLSQANVREWNADEARLRAGELRAERRGLLAQQEAQVSGGIASPAPGGKSGSTPDNPWEGPRNRRESAEHMDERHVHEDQRMRGTATPPTEEMPAEQARRQQKEWDTRSGYDAGQTADRRKAAPAKAAERKADRSGNRADDDRHEIQQRGQQSGREADARKPEQPGETRKKRDDEQRDAARAKLTGRREGDAELSDAKQAKLDRQAATRDLYAEYEAKAKAREKGGRSR